ncbi:hypothetical protein TcWFU_006672 [Taenia crassiceps]|uniref:Uncharacterized protein n=1 Tax=Taenia crassiceps TaxID=6207 RepID=A0ABR4Q0T9_9CEST
MNENDSVKLEPLKRREKRKKSAAIPTQKEESTANCAKTGNQMVADGLPPKSSGKDICGVFGQFEVPPIADLVCQRRKLFKPIQAEDMLFTPRKSSRDSYDWPTSLFYILEVVTSGEALKAQLTSLYGSFVRS